METNHAHYVWGFVAIVGIGIGAWIYSANRPDITNNARGSVPVSNDSHHNSLIDFNPCGVLFTIDSEKFLKKEDRHAVLTNSVAK